MSMIKDCCLEFILINITLVGYYCFVGVIFLIKPDSFGTDIMGNYRAVAVLRISPISATCKIKITSEFFLFCYG